MRFVKAILIVMLVLSPLAGWSIEVAGGKAPEHAAAHEEQGLPNAAVKIGHIGPIVITNSMLVTVILTIGIVIFAQIVSRRVKPIPSGIQNFTEWMVESMYNFLGDILGAVLVKKTFWFFGTIFFFILFTNWFGLIPGVGTVGWKLVDASGQTVGFEPWLRGGNADLNMTSAMALLFFLLWIVWAIQANGVVGSFKHVFAPGVEGSGAMKWFMVGIFLFVGVLETLSILFRPISLSFRLYGNVFAGENVLDSMMHLVPALSWLIPLPFYFLELLVGLVQALVFMLLTAVFTFLICDHGDSHAHAEGEKH